MKEVFEDDEDMFLDQCVAMNQKLIEETNEAERQQKANAKKIVDMFQNRKSQILMIKMASERRLGFEERYAQIDNTNPFLQLYIHVDSYHNNDDLEMEVFQQSCRDVLGSDIKIIQKVNPAQFNHIVKALEEEEKK